MVRKTKIGNFIILGLLLIIFAMLFFYYFYFKTIEGMSVEDDFSVSLNVKLNDRSQGKMVPFPNGSYNVSTTSGNTNSTLDFSMNSVATINTTCEHDASGNPLNRIITISPVITTSDKKNDESDCIIYQDVLPNVFLLDISFNQNTYVLETISDIKASNQINSDKSNQLSFQELNTIDSNGDMNLKAIGPIYYNSVSIGKVDADNSDPFNEKSFKIKVDLTPVIPVQNCKAYINKIKITFKYPIPTLSKISGPSIPLDKIPNQSAIDKAQNPNS